MIPFTITVVCLMPNVAVVQRQDQMICYNQRAPLAHPSPKSLYDFNH